MRFAGRAVLSGLAMIGLAAIGAAADDLSQKLVNDPGSYWGLWGVPAKTHLIAAQGINAAAAQRITVSPKPANPWDIGTYTAIKRPVKKGDVVVLMFWARAQQPPPGSDLIMVSGRIYEAAATGNGLSPETSILIGKQWKLYYVFGTAAKDYPAGALNAGMVLGTGEQTIDFGPVSVYDFGPGFDINSLPRS